MSFSNGAAFDALRVDLVLENEKFSYTNTLITEQMTDFLFHWFNLRFRRCTKI